MFNLILASSSPYRAELLKKIVSNFQQVKPDIEEKALEGETPSELAKRLAFEKARAIATRAHNDPSDAIIGSDQVCYLRQEDGEIELLRKPGGLEAAISMLMRCSGKRVSYETAVCISTGSGQDIQFSVDYALQFRSFTETEAARYCELDEPYNCAGAIKSESHGVMLIDAHHGNDPSALVGLPLIELRKALVKLGVECL